MLQETHHCKGNVFKILSDSRWYNISLRSNSNFITCYENINSFHKKKIDVINVHRSQESHLVNTEIIDTIYTCTFVNFNSLKMYLQILINDTNIL